jgi:uncharacterized repeat protein (TIGR02543 family)
MKKALLLGSALVGALILLSRKNETGQVVNENGGPMNGALVSFAGKQVTTIAAGTFYFPLVTPGTYNLTVQRTGYETHSQSITVSPGKDHALALIRMALIGTIPSYTLTINIAPPSSGSVVSSPSQTSYIKDTIVQLTANASLGNTFDSWSGDATGVAPVINVTMTANKVVTANFKSPMIYDVLVDIA